MISPEEIKTVYENQLKQKLLALEKTRKSILNTYIVISIPVLAVAVAYFVFGGWSFIFILSLILGILAVVALLFMAGERYKAYRTAFKQDVISRIVHAIDPEWSYEADGYISEAEYRSSGLFRTDFNTYKGDDLVCGRIENTDFRCSELHTEYETGNSEGDRNRDTIFKGLFFHADFNKEFSGKTYVSPDVSESLFGRFGRRLQKLTFKGKLVILENPEFENYFVVHATDPTEARYILTPTMMEAIVNLRKKYNRKMRISFTGNRVYCAFSFEEDLFEPRLLEPGVNFRDIKTFYALFMMSATIIKELNLNTRIWTKK